MSKLLRGDCKAIMAEMPENHVTAIVTDAPYGFRFMGKKWDYDVPSVEMFAEMFRVLKPGGMLLCFAGSRTQHRMAVNIEDAGFELRDVIMWVYGSGFPKSYNIGKGVDKKLGNTRTKTGKIKFHSQKGVAIAEKRGAVGGGAFGQAKKEEITYGNSEWEGYGTALKPAYEPIIVAMKPNEGTFVDNALKHGVAGLNIDECRISLNGEKQPSGSGNKARNPSSYTMSGTNNGNITPSSGRFPANLIHDGSDEVMKLFPDTKSGAMNKPYKHTNNCNSLGKPTGYTKQIHSSNSGSAARFFYCAKASRSERNAGCEALDCKIHSDRNKHNLPGGDNPRNRTNTPKKNFHPTVKPLALMTYLTKLVKMPENNLILDPFAGSGSTLIGCIKNDMEFIGIEKEKEYFDIAANRIRYWKDRQNQLKIDI